jgi:hypothetical protein
MNRAFLFTLFLAIVLSLISFWDHPTLGHIKEFIVLIHEICHAVAALLTGGDVKNIVVHGNESGETITIPSPDIKGAFLFVVSAGYLGTSFLGGFLLYRGFLGSGNKAILLLFGFIVMMITMKYSNPGEYTFRVGMAGALAILVSAFLDSRISSIFLVFLGTSLSLYSIYDISDFTENVQQTDAGILAYYLTGYEPDPNLPPPRSVYVLGYLIALTWSFISIGTIYRFILRSLQSTEPEFAPENVYENEETGDPLTEMFPGELTPEVVDWFLARGLDLQGRPLEREFVDGIEKDSEMS